MKPAPLLLISCLTLVAPAIAALPAGPWAENPVVFSQELAGASDADYAAAWTRWRDLGYHPSGLSAVEKAAAPVLYSGLWQKNPRIVDWKSHRKMTDAEYAGLWAAYSDAGFRVLDLDAHVVNNTPLFDAIWVKEVPGKNFYSHRSLTLAELDQKVPQYKQQGYRPIKLNAYPVSSQVRYAAVWVKDGKLDFQLKRDLSSAQYAAWWTAFKNQGYHPVDIAAYTKGGQLRYAGIWLRDAAFEDFVSLREMTASSLLSAAIARKKENFVMVDLDAYYIGGALRFSAIWLRTQRRNVLRGNVPLSTPAMDTLRVKLAEYTTAGVDGRSGAVGFYVEDLTNGNWIAFNPHEHFYLASASKVLIGAKLISQPQPAMSTLSTLTAQSWRGEDDRGFDEADIGQQFPVSEYLANMIDFSDSASTDKLFGMTVAQDGPLAVNAFARTKAGMINVGEITTICQLDKRIRRSASSCVDAVPCHSFETFYRDGGNVMFSTPADLACFDEVDDSPLTADQLYDRYYHTLANSVTPAEEGRFFRQLATHQLLTLFDEAALVEELDKNDSFNYFSGVHYDRWGGKGGDKRKAKSWLGVGWEWDQGAGDYSSVTYTFSVAAFTESWSQADDTAESLASSIMGEAIEAAIEHLVDQR
jgi:hypothetical protein